MATMAVPDGIRTAVTTLGGRALLVEPAGPPRAGTILYFHGGGFVSGSPETALSLTVNLVFKTGFRALSLDYRLAPEDPFPAAVNDGLAAYRALLDAGGDPAAIAFAGDSAGGGTFAPPSGAVPFRRRRPGRRAGRPGVWSSTGS